MNIKFIPRRSEHDVELPAFDIIFDNKGIGTIHQYNLGNASNGDDVLKWRACFHIQIGTVDHAHDEYFDAIVEAKNWVSNIIKVDLGKA